MKPSTYFIRGLCSGGGGGNYAHIGGAETRGDRWPRLAVKIFDFIIFDNLVIFDNVNILLYSIMFILYIRFYHIRFCSAGLLAARRRRAPEREKKKE